MLRSFVSLCTVGSLALAPSAFLCQADDLGLVSVEIESLDTAAQLDAPITFGHVFAVGDVPAGTTLTASLANGQPIPLQVDAKATHSDGSLRHAVLTTQLDWIGAGELESLTLWPTPSVPSDDAVLLEDVLATDFDAVVNLTIEGVLYSVSARDLLIANNSKTWLKGPMVTEWMVDSPFIDPTGQPHPHLAARFNIRVYEGTQRIRVDAVIENTWSYVPNPQNFTYDAQILVSGVEVFAQNNLEHYSHARWRQVLWWGKEPEIHIAHDTAYLIKTKAVPNYDQDVIIAESALAAMDIEWNSADRGPMTIGFPVSYMPMTGGRREIGPMPRWSARYLLSMDQRAKTVSLGTATLAGTWSIHYRDQLTGQPASLEDYPTMSLLSSNNPDQFPDCNDCSNPNRYDSAHQPAFAFLPYLVTGDYYYLEELQFWANLNMIESNPEYRGRELGLLKWGQVRGQAWSLRTLGQAAYITPDDHPLKFYFEDRVGYNLDWYLQEYPNNPAANVLGFMANGYAFAYNNGRGVAGWQDDYFTWAAGYLAELGFDGAHELATWKGAFPTGRMTASGYCWISGAPYKLNVRDSSASPPYTTFAQAYNETFSANITTLACGGSDMADALNLQVGEMTGYSSSPQGYPSYMQPALAIAVQNCVPDAAQAWDIFMDRTVKPDYGIRGPEFAIVPRFALTDLNKDGLTDILDVTIFLQNHTDLNNDGVFDVIDVFEFIEAYLESGCP